MNGFADRGLDESNFDASSGPSLRAFDAFPKTKHTYLTRTAHGSASTILLIALTLYLTFTELRRSLAGTTTHTYAVETAVSTELAINLDVVIAMRCHDLHVNVQDASGDRIMAGEALHKDDTEWSVWQIAESKGRKRGKGKGDRWLAEQAAQYSRQEDVHDYIAAARGRPRFPKTPRLGRHEADSCRIYGTIESNKVQGDFHITARGHGYMEFGNHLDHSAFNFSHHVSTLSFGPLHRDLHNPLDLTTSTTAAHFFKYQYYLSLVPTVYTDALPYLDSLDQPGPHTKTFNPYMFSPHTVFTNQYAVTEQSRQVGEQSIPGIFVKFDFEPVTVVVSEEWGGWLALLVRLVNVVAGVLVGGGWLVSLIEWGGEVMGRRVRRRTESAGLLYSGGEKQGLD
ncbi:MAG: hypothetical protein M1828_007520 [Chrysothrix sp. TS-e1954]|nr:MAG: hypothetical protein M1828_007520 [Chrysothrix sp. TS-e1954]